MLTALVDAIQKDMIYGFARALIVAILVSSEGLLARRKALGFERHLILFTASLVLMGAELSVVAAGIFAYGDTAVLPGGVWVWYPVLTTTALLGVAFCFDFVGAGDDGDLRPQSRRYLLIAAGLLAGATLLTDLPFNTRSTVVPTSYGQMRLLAALLHAAQAGVFVALAWKALRTVGRWLSHVESRVFAFGCAAGAAGALAQIVNGPREHLTTLAYTTLVAVILRDNYRRSEMEAVRAAEDRRARMLLFHRITTQLKSSFDLPRLYEILMDSIIGHLGAESGAIYLRASNDACLRPEYIHGPFPPPKPLPDWCPNDLRIMEGIVRQMEVRPGEGIIGFVAETGRPVYLVTPDDVGRRFTWRTGPVVVRTVIALPLRSPEGIYGVVMVANRMDGEAFSEEDIRFMSLLTEQAGLAIYNARLHAERLERQRVQEQITIARAIQLRLLPAQLPTIPGLAIGAEYAAAQEVGGDYYDLYRIDHDHLGLLVFDVAGKGVPGALLMAITATFLKMAAPRSPSPAWVLNEVNAALAMEMHRGLYVTAAYAVLKLSTGEVTLCNAGHPEALVVRGADLSCERRKPRGAALGLLRPNRFRAVLEQETFRLNPGDTLLLYTDGVSEARNAAGEEFGDERLTHTAQQFALLGPSTLAAEILAAVRRHAGEQPQYDDTTVLALQLLPPTPPVPSAAPAGTPPA